MRDNFLYVSRERWESLFGGKGIVIPRELEKKIKINDMEYGPGEEDVSCWVGGNANEEESCKP
jgi:hypothetical protein